MSEKKDRFIKKSNILSQKATAGMNVTQTRIKNAVISIATPSLVEGETTVVVKSSDIKSLIGLPKGGKSNNIFMDALNNAINEFVERVPVYDSETGVLLLNKEGIPRYKYIYCFSEVEPLDQMIRFKFNPDYIPYVIPKTNFSINSVTTMNKLSSIYSQKLYDFFKSLESFEKKYNKKPVRTIDELRVLLLVNDLSKYETWDKFKTRCINKPIAEINQKTDLFISYQTIKEGRKITALEFSISKKQHVIEADVNIADSSKNIAKEKDYYGCLLTEDQYDEIVEQAMKSKIIELGNIKQQNPTAYRKYQGKDGNKTDYEIILNFIAKDKLNEEAKKKTDQIKITTPEYLQQKQTDGVNAIPDKELLQQIREMQAKMGSKE